MPTERPRFRPDIEGLRGAAILLVVAFHASVPRVTGGFVGVDVFFVLSGFLITGLLAREIADTGDVDLTEFYARRARRLLPALLVVLLATLATGLWLYAPIDRPPIATDARAVALHYGNVLFAQTGVNYHASNINPFLHTWSLAVEEQFYFVWPLLFVLVARWYAGKESTRRQLITAVALAGAASFGISLWITSVAQPWAFFGMPTRVWEFALGGLAALVFTGDARRTVGASAGGLLQVAGLLAIGLAAATYDQATPYPGIAALLPALGAAAVIVGGIDATTSVASRALGAPLLQWFGRMSYSWYLWHWPLVGIGAVLDWRIGVAGKLAWSAVALGLAVLTYHFVERPLRNNEVFRARPQVVNVFSMGASVAAALIAVAAFSLARHQVSSAAQAPFAAARHDGMSHDCWGSLLDNATGPCVFGDRNGMTRVVLMGDSHAEHWLAAMDRIGRERGWKVYAMVKPACPAADIPAMMNARLKRHYTECSTWRREKLRRILAMRPSLVVLSSYDHYVASDGAKSSWQVTPATWRAGLRQTFALLSNAGIPTVVMRDNPEPGFDIPACLSRRASSAPFGRTSCDYDRDASLMPVAIAAQTDAARGLDHIAFVSMLDRFCSGRSCSPVRNGAVVFRDDDHLTATFSRREAPVLATRLDAAVRTLPR